MWRTRLRGLTRAALVLACLYLLYLAIQYVWKDAYFMLMLGFAIAACAGIIVYERSSRRAGMTVALASIVFLWATFFVGVDQRSAQDLVQYAQRLAKHIR
jgi:hypothetical protein